MTLANSNSAKSSLWSDQASSWSVRFGQIKRRLGLTPEDTIKKRKGAGKYAAHKRIITTSRPKGSDYGSDYDSEATIHGVGKHEGGAGVCPPPASTSYLPRPRIVASGPSELSI